MELRLHPGRTHHGQAHIPGHLHAQPGREGDQGHWAALAAGHREHQLDPSTHTAGEHAQEQLGGLQGAAEQVLEGVSGPAQEDDDLQPVQTHQCAGGPTAPLG